MSRDKKYLYLKIRTGPPGLLTHGTPWRPPGSLGSQEARSQGPWGPKRPGPRVPGSQCPRVPESLGSQEARSQGPRVPWGPMGSYIGLARKKSSIPKSQDLLEKINNFDPLIILWHLINAITPTSILIFIAAFEFGLQKLIYTDLMQVL